MRLVRRLAPLLAVIVAAAVSTSGRAQVALERFEGILTVAWGDPGPGATTGEIRYSLTLPNGRTLPLQVAAQHGAAQFHAGKRVIVRGRATSLPAQAAQAANAAIVVEELAAAEGETAQAAVVGMKRVIFLLAKFSDDAAVPHPPSFYANLTNPDTPPPGEVFPATINGFFKKTSYGQFWWTADIGGAGGLGAPGGWLTLPRPKSYYAPCGSTASCANVSALANDAMAVGRAAGIDFRIYDTINFVLSNDLDCCAWGGSFYSAVDNKSYGATWEPPWGQETSVYAHEMGHSLGLPHSGWVYYAYDSPWDVMSARRSASSVACGSYRSANSGQTVTLTCTSPGDGYIAAHKDYLGWLPYTNEVTTDVSSSVTVALEGNSLPLGGAVKIIKICLPGFACYGSTARYYTVEARVRGLGALSDYDNGLAGEGVIIHHVQMDRAPVAGACFGNNQSGWAMPVDSTPGDYDSATCRIGARSFPNYGLYNAQFSPGQAYTDATYGFTISVLSRSGSTFTIRVSGPSPQSFSKASPASGASAVPRPATLSWNTSSGASRYEYCLGVSNNGCQSGWIAVGLNTSAIVNLNASTTYYWQVRAVNVAGSVEANGGTWWSFTTDTAAPRPAADFNADGRPDLVWRNSATGQNVVWFMNDAQQLGTALLPDVTDPNWNMALIADFNDDAKPDILWRHAVTGENVVWLLNGVSVAAVVNWPSVYDASWIVYAAADVNGDRRSDVLWRHAITGDRAVWFVANGNVTGSGGAAPLADMNFRPAGVLDINRDGVAEIVQRQEITGVNQAINLDGTLNTSLPSVSDPDWVIAATADFDGDGQSDILWRHLMTGQNLLWHMNGAALRDSAWVPSLADANWRTPQQLRRREPTDMNGDGTPDIVWRHSSTGQNALWYMSGTWVNSTRALPEVTDTNWKLAAIADFNRDSFPDFVWRHATTGDDVLWLMKGTTVLQTVQLTPVSTTSWNIVGAADLNADSSPDLLWRNSVTGENVVWYMNGASIASTASLTNVSDTNWQLVATADLNRDHRPDLIWRNGVTGENVVWYLYGVSIASTAPLPTVSDTTWTVAMATDINGDGSPDFLWRNTASGANAVWFMSGANVLSTAGVSAVDPVWLIVK